MKLRLMTLKTPLFDHGGMVIDDKKWHVVDTDSLTAEGRAAIPKYRGHIVQVHPDDVSKLPELDVLIAADVAKATAMAKAKK